MMHRIHTYGYRLAALLCIVLGMGCGLLNAQNYVGASVAGHVPFTSDNMPITRSHVGYGGELGFAYELHRNHFTLTTGLQYNLLSTSLSVADQQLEQAMLDTRGVPFIYRGWLSNRTDAMSYGQVVLPLYVGGSWSGFYIMAGLKAGFYLHGKAVQTAQLKTAGDYEDRYYEWVESMPNHGYHDYQPVASSHAMTFNNFDLRLCGELGYTVKLQSAQSRALPPFLRIGLFAEYGMTNIHNAKSIRNTPRTQADYSQYMSVQMTHIYASEDAAPKSTHLVTCGLRLTILFPVASDNYIYPCRCANDRW